MISVIVPVYNAENYIEKCLNSLVNQKINDYEILIIDDGSTDRSRVICESFQNKYNQVKLFCQNNSGVSAARNRGLEAAKGEYIIFVDADDWIKPDTLEKIQKNIQIYKPDVIIYGILYIKNDIVTYEFNMEEKICCTPEETSDYIKEIYKTGIIASPVNKVYSREAIGDNRFNEKVNYGEDLQFNMQVFLSVNSIVNLSEMFYCYNNHENSLSSNIDMNQVKDMLLLYEKSKQFLCNKVNDRQARENLLERHYFEYLYPLEIRMIGKSKLLNKKQKKVAVKKILCGEYYEYLKKYLEREFIGKLL